MPPGDDPTGDGGPARTAPTVLARGRTAFNRGDFFEAHDEWENIWRRLDPGPDRIFLQGLIQIAAGLHLLQRGRTAPAARLLGKGLKKVTLEQPLLAEGMAVQALAVGVEELLTQLAKTPAAKPAAEQLRL